MAANLSSFRPDLHHAPLLNEHLHRHAQLERTHFGGVLAPANAWPQPSLFERGKRGTKRSKALSNSDRDFLQRLVSDVVGGRAQRKNSQALYGLVDGPDAWVGAGEARPGVPLTRNDAVRWASLTKLVSAIFVAWMIDQNALPNPSASIGETMPEFEQSRLRVLASHTDNHAKGQTVPASAPITWNHVFAMQIPIQYEAFVVGGDETGGSSGFGNSPFIDGRFTYSDMAWKRHHGFYPALDPTFLFGCYDGQKTTKTKRLQAWAQIPLEHQPGKRECAHYGPSLDSLGTAYLARHGRGVKPMEAFTKGVLKPLNATRTFFEGGQTARPKGLSVVELAFQYWAPRTMPFARRDPRCMRNDTTYWASECPRDGWAVCDRLHTGSPPTSANEDPYAGMLGGGAIGPLDDYAKLLKLIARRGKADDGTQVISEAALTIALQPVAHCDCFRPPSPGGKCTFSMTQWCNGDYWGLGACFKAGGKHDQTVGELVARIHAGESPAAVAAGLQYPEQISWSGWYGLYYKLDIKRQRYFIIGSGTQPYPFDPLSINWNSEALPWFDNLRTTTEEA